MAAIRSRKLRASPVPTLKMPDTDGVSSSQRITATVSSTKMKSRFCSPSADAVAVRLEQAHRLAALGLVEPLGDKAHHLALVIFVRAEHVKEFEAGALRR